MIYSLEEQKSYTEVYDIIMFLDDNLKKKIPTKMIEYLEKVKLKDYVTNINPYVPLEYQKLRKDTKLIISYIFLRYLCDEEEKRFLRKKNIKKD